MRKIILDIPTVPRARFLILYLLLLFFRGEQTDFCWQVEILVNDGGGTEAVEAGTLGTVTTAAALYDTNGCASSGCTASLTRVRRFDVSLAVNA